MEPGRHHGDEMIQLSFKAHLKEVGPPLLRPSGPRALQLEGSTVEGKTERLKARHDACHAKPSRLTMIVNSMPLAMSEALQSQLVA